MTMNSASIAAQVRSLAADLLYASGYTRDEIDDAWSLTERGLRASAKSVESKHAEGVS